MVIIPLLFHPPCFFPVLLQINLHYPLSVPTGILVPNNLPLLPTTPATRLHSEWTC